MLRWLESLFDKTTGFLGIGQAVFPIWISEEHVEWEIAGEAGKKEELVEEV